MASQIMFNSMKWSLYPTDSFEHFTFEVPLLNYTLPHVYPVFAITQDEEPIVHDSPNLNNNGGILANFRGLTLALLQSITTSGLIGYYGRFLGFKYHIFARLLRSLLMVQFSTLWLHLVIAQTDRPFWSRVPPFKRTLQATWRATILHWAAVELTGLFPSMVASRMNIDWPSPGLFGPDNTYSFRLDMAAGDAIFYFKCAAVIFATVVGSISLSLASLLPVEDSTIIPFDRSFKGRRGLIILSFKIIILSLSLILLMCAVISLQWVMIVTQSMEINEYL
ncbi:hypothetical protein M431DRAFT_501297 [Trichoderma harzianum CBS 226.95]|uniref:Uncharacterized protein n=1 Tax=Trichoderma harzianum CBS 226.95 TaxID=983964 RepID=A0A2T3ZTU0_TRIHA|nr:hypothetical protein M431DRAFT_501297 [Trichoderma harzianum CBS 226.95]PTB48218.1 hypothetical protein M431DRAFT_501297 [Trichoderma harzianum CBS 226.95]